MLPLLHDHICILFEKFKMLAIHPCIVTASAFLSRKVAIIWEEDEDDHVSDDKYSRGRAQDFDGQTKEEIKEIATDSGIKCQEFSGKSWDYEEYNAYLYEPKQKPKISKPFEPEDCIGHFCKFVTSWDQDFVKRRSIVERAERFKKDCHRKIGQETWST